MLKVFPVPASAKPVVIIRPVYVLERLYVFVFCLGLIGVQSVWVVKPFSGDAETNFNFMLLNLLVGNLLQSVHQGLFCDTLVDALFIQLNRSQFF